MTKDVILITGGDAKFYKFIDEALNSLTAINIDQKADIGFLDLGLSQDQKDTLASRGCIIKKPTWTLSIPENIREDYQLGLIARTALRDYFPGYKVYLWFDADAWAQTPEFFELMVEGALSNGAAVIRENGSGYHRNFLYNRWWYGHMIASYGIMNGIKVALKPAINIGLVALSDNAPHWNAWIRHYEAMITRRGKPNLDQHAFNAALELENLPYSLLPARCNWICTLSTPQWDSRQRKFCEPNSSGIPLSVLHLAGPNKRRDYSVYQTEGQPLATPLTYSAMLKLNSVPSGNQ